MSDKTSKSAKERKPLREAVVPPKPPVPEPTVQRGYVAHKPPAPAKPQFTLQPPPKPAGPGPQPTPQTPSKPAEPPKPPAKGKK